MRLSPCNEDMAPMKPLETQTLRTELRERCWGQWNFLKATRDEGVVICEIINFSSFSYQIVEKFH